MTLETAAKQLSKTIEMAEHDGCLPESHTPINDASRALIQAMFDAHGPEIGVGDFNPRQGFNPHRAADRADASLWHNFGIDFITPAWDATLREMLLERLMGPYRGVAADSIALDLIMERIDNLGGYTLVWT